MYFFNHKIVIAGLALMATSAAWSGEYNTGYFGDVAIKGYDPVAYFTEQRALKGEENISHKWFGANWQFASEEHKQMFTENPVKYAPQYGGLCADGVAYGEFTVNIDPEAWRIIEGKLYLNYNEGSAEEIETVDGQVDKANKNWPRIQKQMQQAYNQ